MTSPYTATFRDGTPYPVIPAATTVVNVAGPSALAGAVTAASAGSRLVLAAGSYSSLALSGKNGTSSAGITIEAAAGATVTFTGKMTISNCSYLTLRRLVFNTDPEGDLANIRGNSHHVKIHRCTFGPAIHPGQATTGEGGNYLFIGDTANNIVVSYCEFRNKSRAGNGIRVYGNFDTQTMCKYIVIDHCDIHDFHPAVVNDFEPIRLGVSSMSLTDAFGHVERNVITGIRSEPEIISIKSGKCRVYGNSILQSAGGPVIRHGLDSTMTDNYVIDGRSTTNTNNEGSGGPRFYDVNHVVSYNLLQGLSGTSYQAALQLDGGDSGSSLSRHAIVRNAQVQRNIIVECATPITVNAHYGVAPSACRVEDNIVAASGSAAVQYLRGATAAGTGTVARNDWFATPAAAGLVKGANGAYARSGYGPRVPMLTRADVGPNGDLAETDGLGEGSSGGDPGGGFELTVSAGADAQVLPGATFTRTATETGTGTVATRAWTVVAIPAGATTPTVGTSLGTAAALTWTAPTVPGVYTLRYAASAAGGALLDDDEVAVAVATNPAVPVSTTPIVVEPEPLAFVETFGTPTFELVATTVPVIPTYPGLTTFPGPTTFPGYRRDTRYRKQRSGWTTYPGPDLFPGPTTWPGFGRPGPIPPFDVEFFLLDDAGGYRCALPDVTAFTLTDVANSPGGVGFDYPAHGINAELLREHVDADVDARIAVRFAGSAEWERQALISECDNDDVAASAVWQFRGAWSAAVLDESVVYPDPGTSDGRARFTEATPGAIVTELVARAQQRGGMDISTATFSSEWDSRADPWPADTVASPTFTAGDSSTYLRVLQLLHEAGLAEWEMRGRSLRLYRPGTRGHDRTVGAQVVLQAGRDLLEASRRRTVRGSVTSLLVIGADGEWQEVADDTALGRRRRRVEGTASQGQLSGGALRAYGFAKLATATDGQVERVHKLAFVDGSPLPVRDFDVGDRLWSDSDGRRRRLRVQQWTISRDAQGLSGSVSLGDLINDPLLKLARKLLGLGDGSTVGAASTGGPKAVEGVTPGAPTGLTVDSVSVPRADGSSAATLLLSWNPVVVAADGVSGVNVTGYRVRWRYTALVGVGATVPLAGEWTLLDDLGNDTQTQIEDVVPSAQIEVQVGAYSVVTTTPSTPTTPGTPGTVASGPIPVGSGGGGSGTPTLTPVAQAAQAILDRFNSGQLILDDWSWVGMPSIVDQNLTAVQTAYITAGRPTDHLAWLRQFIAAGTSSGGGAPTGTTVAEILRIGRADGLTKVNLGVDFLAADGPAGKKGKHHDYPLAEIEAGLGSEVMPKYVAVRPNGAVRLTAFVGAATTPNSKKSRTEFRELAANGVDRAFWSATSGRHYLWVRGAVIKLPQGRQRMCIAQCHATDDDLCMILVDQGSNVESTFGDSGRPGRLTSNLELGRVYEWMIELVREGSQTLINYYWDDMSTPKARQTYDGAGQNYWKVGNYQQSEPQYDQVGETGIIDLHNIEIWHTGYPPPRARAGGSSSSGITAWVAITEQAYTALAVKDPRTVYIVGALDANATSRPLTSAAVLSQAAYDAITTPDPATLYILADDLATTVILDTVVPISAAAYAALTSRNARAIYLVT